MCNITLGGNYDDRGYEVHQTFDDGIIIRIGTTTDSAGGFDVLLMKTDLEDNIANWFLE